jgi:hypothetical protein
MMIVTLVVLPLDNKKPEPSRHSNMRGRVDACFSLGHAVAAGERWV